MQSSKQNQNRIVLYVRENHTIFNPTTKEFQTTGLMPNLEIILLDVVVNYIPEKKKSKKKYTGLVTDTQKGMPKSKLKGAMRSKFQ